MFTSLGKRPDFRCQGIAEINLGVFNDKTIAHKFYQKFGFKLFEQKIKTNT